MNVCVQNCFHWIGYHIVHQLISSGYSVYGINEQMTKQAEFLSFFLGRNSLFTFVEDSQANYDIDITVHLDEHNDEILFENDHHLELIQVKKPLLFGEWMDMDEEGFYDHQRYVQFNSQEFIKNAIYIESFTKSLVQWIGSTYVPSEFSVYPARKPMDKDIKLDNTIYIRDNIPIETKVRHLLEHFKKYKNIYYFSQDMEY